MDDIRTIKDEHGEIHELVCLGGLYVAVRNFQNNGRLCVDIQEQLLYDDDVILATNPKTGNSLQPHNIT